MKVTSSGIDIAMCSQQLINSSAGAFAGFEGWVRNYNDGHKVLQLEYEVYTPIAESEGRKIIQEAKERFDILDAQGIHRSGLLEIIKSWEENPKKITCTSAGKNHGPPVIFPKRYFSKLLKIKGDNGAKDLLSSHDKNLIKIINNHAFIDIDSINDLKNIT